jgi:hypothetical protein
MLTAMLAHLCFIGLAATARPQATTLVPEKAVIAVLPVADKTGIQDPKIAKAICEQGLVWLRSSFADRGFTLTDTAKVEEALVDLKHDIQDRDFWNTQALKKVGDLLKCDVVVFCAATETHSQSSGSDIGYGLFASKDGFATIKVWVVETGSGKALVKALRCEAKSKSGVGGLVEKGAAKQVRALQLAIDKALAEFLKPYPLVKKQ